MHPYRPESLTCLPPPPEALHKNTGEIFEAMCVKCDEFHNLHVDLGPIRGVIPREETALGIVEGQTREIAILSRVGKPVAFQVLGFDSRGTAILSRRAAQAEAKRYFLSTLRPGDVIPTVIQNPVEFGAFCDIGCGYTGLLRIDRCCVSRLRSTAERFHTGEAIYAAVLSVDPYTGQVLLTTRELLGTWEENAAAFRPGQTVTGVVRSRMSYGLFVELTPNLSGLAESDTLAQPGDTVSVYIRSIQADKHKIKLNILEVLPAPLPQQTEFFITSGHLDRWEYFPGSGAVTVF